MKTLSDFKRALQTEGASLETLALVKGAREGRIKLGSIRPVIKSNTVGVYLETEGSGANGSFLEYGKASEWEFEGDIARNIEWGYAYRVVTTEEKGE
jgi:hypothetical protein